jgi:hypothetical protein
LPNNSLQLTGPAAEKRPIRKRMRLARQLSSRPLGSIALPDSRLEVDMFDLRGAWIGPHYLQEHIDLETSSIDDRVALFEDRVRGYFTTPSRLLANMYENSGALILIAVLSCIELIEVLHRGESSQNRSAEFFKSGFRRVFNPQPPSDVPLDVFESQLQRMLDELYVQVRCGLMHAGTTRSKVLIRKDLNAPAVVNYNATQGRAESIVVNPNRCLLALDVFVSEYCCRLRNHDNKELRDAFDQGWLALRSEG